MTPAAAVDAATVDRARPKVAFIVGPTGVGKSDLAIAIAERLDGAIVNGDARQLYRGMDLGTAKPDAAARARVPHYLFDLHPPAAPLDAAGFARAAREAIETLAARARPVIVVGGSGLYLRALRAGICAGPPASPTLRAELRALAAEAGSATLHARLMQRDPVTAARLSPNDTQRIVRALEVVELTGVPISRAQAAHRFADHPFTTLTIGLTLPRELLYANITRRFLTMVDAGLVEEVRRLLEVGVDPTSVPLKTIGYREIADYLEGRCTLDEAIARAQQATRRLAKRQMTWFRADREITWMDPRSALEPATACLTTFFNQADA